MVYCQVIGCVNDSSRTKGKSYFSIPNPLKDHKRCEEWLAALRLEKFSTRTYKYDRNNVVCSDHFSPDCFLPDLRAELMQEKPRRLLKPDAVPNIFPHQAPVKTRPSSEGQISKALHEKYIRSVLEESEPSGSMSLAREDESIVESHEGPEDVEVLVDVDLSTVEMITEENMDEPIPTIRVLQGKKYTGAADEFPEEELEETKGLEAPASGSGFILKKPNILTTGMPTKTIKLALQSRPQPKQNKRKSKHVTKVIPEEEDEAEEGWEEVTEEDDLLLRRGANDDADGEELKEEDEFMRAAEPIEECTQLMPESDTGGRFDHGCGADMGVTNTAEEPDQSMLESDSGGGFDQGYEAEIEGDEAKIEGDEAKIKGDEQVNELEDDKEEEVMEEEYEEEDDYEEDDYEEESVEDPNDSDYDPFKDIEESFVKKKSQLGKPVTELEVSSSEGSVSSVNSDEEEEEAKKKKKTKNKTTKTPSWPHACTLRGDERRKHFLKRQMERTKKLRLECKLCKDSFYTIHDFQLHFEDKHPGEAEKLVTDLELTLERKRIAFEEQKEREAQERKEQRIREMKKLEKMKERKKKQEKKAQEKRAMREKRRSAQKAAEEEKMELEKMEAGQQRKSTRLGLKKPKTALELLGLKCENSGEENSSMDTQSSTTQTECIPNTNPNIPLHERDKPRDKVHEDTKLLMDSILQEIEQQEAENKTAEKTGNMIEVGATAAEMEEREQSLTNRESVEDVSEPISYSELANICENGGTLDSCSEIKLSDPSATLCSKDLQSDYSKQANNPVSNDTHKNEQTKSESSMDESSYATFPNEAIDGRVDQGDQTFSIVNECKVEESGMQSDVRSPICGESESIANQAEPMSNDPTSVDGEEDAEVVTDSVETEEAEFVPEGDADVVFELDAWSNILLGCTECSSFISFWQYKSHLDEHNKRETIECERCGKKYQTEKGLRFHQKVHCKGKKETTKGGVCEICGKSVTNVQVHLRTHRGHTLSCKICNATFSRKGSLDRHMNVHSSVKEHVCEVCGRSFSQAGNLKGHMRQHTNEKPYKCVICEKSFMHNISLKTHQKRDHGMDPWMGASTAPVGRRKKERDDSSENTAKKRRTQKNTTDEDSCDETAVKRKRVRKKKDNTDS